MVTFYSSKNRTHNLREKKYLKVSVGYLFLQALKPFAAGTATVRQQNKTKNTTGRSPHHGPPDTHRYARLKHFRVRTLYIPFGTSRHMPYRAKRALTRLAPRYRFWHN